MKGMRQIYIRYEYPWQRLARSQLHTNSKYKSHARAPPLSISQTDIQTDCNWRWPGYARPCLLCALSGKTFVLCSWTDCAQPYTIQGRYTYTWFLTECMCGLSVATFMWIIYVLVYYWYVRSLAYIRTVIPLFLLWSVRQGWYKT